MINENEKQSVICFVMLQSACLFQLNEFYYSGLRDDCMCHFQTLKQEQNLSRCSWKTQPITFQVMTSFSASDNFCNFTLNDQS